MNPINSSNPSDFYPQFKGNDLTPKQKELVQTIIEELKNEPSPPFKQEGKQLHDLMNMPPPIGGQDGEAIMDAIKALRSGGPDAANQAIGALERLLKP